MKVFPSRNYTVGQLNAMVKKLIEQVGEDGPKLLLQNRLKIEVMIPQVVNPVDTIKIGRRDYIFDAREFFILNLEKIRISNLWHSFQDMFFEDDRYYEDPELKHKISYGDLAKKSVDSEIIEEFACDNKFTVKLSDIAYFLLRQPTGKERGVLLTNSLPNIFYTKDKKGLICSVSVRLDDEGWDISANSFAFRNEWIAGARVFIHS